MEKKNSSNLILFIISGVFFFCVEFCLTAEELAKGKIIPQVVCQDEPEQSYALFLPSYYTKEKKWPVLVAFEPAARAMIPLTRFRHAAEKYGYILVCSRQARNGPSDPIITAMKALWHDILKRLSPDRKRIFATGFSGGARVSSFFNKVINNPVRGLIACGAGLSEMLKLDQLDCNFYYGITGIADFNYQEMRKLDLELDGTGIIHRFVYFKGPHQWPVENICTQALEWMELQSMKAGLRPIDDDIIKSVYRSELEKIRELEKGELKVFSLTAYRSMVELFESLYDVTLLKQKIKELKVLKNSQRFEIQEQKQRKKETEILQNFIGLFAYIIKQQPGQDMNKIISGFNIPEHSRKARDEKNIFKSGFHFRLLSILNLKARKQIKPHLDKKDLFKATIFAEITARSSQLFPWYGYDLYNLATVYAIAGESKKAIKYLSRAVEHGFDDIELLLTDKKNYWDKLKKRSTFKAIIKNLRQRKLDKKDKND